MNVNDILIGCLILSGLLQWYFNWSYDVEIKKLKDKVKKLEKGEKDNELKS